MSGSITDTIAHTLHQSAPFKVLSNSDRNSGVNVEILCGAGKAQAEIAACQG
jgi:hypothetical protein